MHAERRVGTHGQRRPRVRPPGRRRPLPVRARLLPLRSSLRARSAVCHRTSLQALCAVPVWCHSCGFCVNAWWRLSFSAANSMPCHATHAFAQERCCMHPCKRPPPKYGSRLRPPPLPGQAKVAVQRLLSTFLTARQPHMVKVNMRQDREQWKGRGPPGAPVKTRVITCCAHEAASWHGVAAGRRTPSCGAKCSETGGTVQQGKHGAQARHVV